MGDSSTAGSEQKQAPKGPNGCPIRTHNEYPPIPIRSLDWYAYYAPVGREWDGDPEGQPDLGWGSTEQAAIQDLIDNYDEPESNDAEK